MLRIIALAFVLLSPLRWIYVVDDAKCNGCCNCISSCPQGAISLVAGNAYIDPELCDGCGTCVNHCPRGAIYREWYTGIEEDESEPRTVSFSQNPVPRTSVTVTGIVPFSSVQIIDRAGRQILQAVADKDGHLTVSLSNMPEGSYLVVTEQGSAVFTAI